MPPSSRRSPLHSRLAELNPTWGKIAGMPVPLDFGHPGPERTGARRLAITDATALPRSAYKGPTAQEFLTSQAIAIPSAVYGVELLPGGGLIVRTGETEFFLEDGCAGNVVRRLDRIDPLPAGCLRMPREDAAILVAGELWREVFLQSCAYEFRDDRCDFVMTRVAGVSCSVLPRELQSIRLAQLWCDGTYAGYLWETLLAIVRDLGGNVAGLACFFNVVEAD